MQLRAKLFLLCFLIEVGREGVFKTIKKFFVLLTIRVLFLKFLGRIRMAYIRTAWSKNNLTFNCMHDDFHFALWSWPLVKSIQIYEKWYFFSIFSSLDPFPWVFRQVKEWLILELDKMIRVSNLVASIDFNLFYERSW